MPFTNEFKDKYVAPHISSFTAATIPDMSAVSEAQGHWLLSFVLNSGLVVTMDDATRRTLYNFLRRAERAFGDYEAARQAALAYLTNLNPDAVSEYIIAIGHWESFLSQAYQAWCRSPPAAVTISACSARRPGASFHARSGCMACTRTVISRVKRPNPPPPIPASAVVLPTAAHHPQKSPMGLPPSGPA